MTLETAVEMRPQPQPQPLGAAMGGRIILVFASNTLVLNAEDLLDEMELDFELIPVPKEVNPNCGLAISFLEVNSPEIMAALAKANLKPEAVYRRAGNVFQPFDDKAREAEHKVM